MGFKLTLKSSARWFRAFLFIFFFFKAEKLYIFGKICFSDKHKIPWLHLIYLLGEDALQWRFFGSPNPWLLCCLEARILFTKKSECGWWEGNDICLSLILIRSWDGARVPYRQSLNTGFVAEYINLCWEEIPDIKWVFNLADKFQLGKHHTLFAPGMINHWNKLPVELMNSTFLDAFESRLHALLNWCASQTRVIAKYNTCYWG